jgi:AcrR family transcriptional regulator
MNKTTSKLATSRQTGRHQVDEQRSSILDAAEKLFLQNGLEKTRMIDIAAQAGITKMSLYRYFPNRDVIALQIQARMMDRIASQVDPGSPADEPVSEPELSLEMARSLARSMIRNFPALRDAYRYMAMFDSLYLDNPPDPALVQWTKNQLQSLSWTGRAGYAGVPDESSASVEAPAFTEAPSNALKDISREGIKGDRIIMVISTVIWFLEKLALRGELTWSDQAVPLEEHLKLFEEMILGYLNQVS